MNPGRVVLFGATGYTGRLTAEALVSMGMAPVLAGRDRDRLIALTEDLAVGRADHERPTWQVADVHDPASVRALIHDASDVLVTTVGPFAQFGHVALDAAINAGAGYVDSTGEHTFIKHVFTAANHRAQESGARLLTAFGYDYVPGNLAGALALQAAHDRDPARLEIGYFIRGSFGISSGTRASAVGMMLEPCYTVRNAMLVSERTAKRIVRFTVDGHTWQALSIGGSEHFTMPRLEPHLDQIEVALGWAGRLTPLAHAGGAFLSSAARIPGLMSLVRRPTTTGRGPDAQSRAQASTLVIARVADRAGRHLTQVVVEGPSPYDLTAHTLTWGAQMLAAGCTTEVGALGPTDAFGLPAFVEGCRSFGLQERS
jgi:short subunit dehydrogenase-like uncharacterized protein